MTDIEVSVCPRSERSELHPRYDADSDILAIESRIHRSWTFGVDIGGNIVFDLDQSRLLANVDLHIGKRLWKPAEGLRWPPSPRPGGLIFSEATVRHKSFELAIVAEHDTLSRILRVAIGGHPPTEFVEVSRNCVGLLSERRLVGLLVRGL
jgi:hypothetical protein